jgi:hypothetical protein
MKSYNIVTEAEKVVSSYIEKQNKLERKEVEKLNKAFEKFKKDLDNNETNKMLVEKSEFIMKSYFYSILAVNSVIMINSETLKTLSEILIFNLNNDIKKENKVISNVKNFGKKITLLFKGILSSIFNYNKLRNK